MTCFVTDLGGCIRSLTYNVLTLFDSIQMKLKRHRLLGGPQSGAAVVVFLTFLCSSTAPATRRADQTANDGKWLLVWSDELRSAYIEQEAVKRLPHLCCRVGAERDSVLYRPRALQDPDWRRSSCRRRLGL